MMTRVLIALCVLVALPALSLAMDAVNFMQISHTDDQWLAWKAQHGKYYSPKEEMYRRYVFHENLRKISEHNAKYPLSVSYVKGLNQFSDMTVDEFRRFNRLQPITHNGNGCSSKLTSGRVNDLPPSVDWRTKGYVTEVKNQGECGSCWAFSTTGSLEGQHFKKTGTLLSLSEQQLVDCSDSFGNQGCDGGMMDQGFEYIMNQQGGLETESDYPYTAQDGTCYSDPSLEKAKVVSCVDVESGSEAALKQASATVGPISVAIDASNDSFQSYSSGVYYEPYCSNTTLDHGVLVVGYGTYQGTDYWLVKNSWSTDWGMNGYIMMQRNKDNMCGIATMASYPTV